MAPEKLAEFRKSHPIDFSLLDQDDQAVMYISEDKGDWALHLTIANTSSQAITLTDGQGEPSGTNHHFALRFRPGTLSKRTLGLLTGQEFKNVVKAPWVLAKLEQPAPDAKATLYLLYTGKKILAGNETISLEISGISAEPASGSRGTQVELIPNGKLVKFTDQTEVTGSRTQYLHVTNHSGRKNIPLHMGLVEGNRILNGATDGKLTLRITNVFQSKDLNKSAKIMFRGSGDSKTKLVLSYDAGEDDWALARKDVAAKVTPPANATVVPFTQGESPDWVITFNQDFPLESRKSFDITIENLAVSPKPGNANLYLRYENIPGYWDGQFVYAVEKGPIVVKDGNVGIGNPSPKSPLSFSASLGDKISLWQLHETHYGFGIQDKLLQIHTDISESDVAFGHGRSSSFTETMRIRGNGYVGIGTPKPQNALDIKGGLVIGSNYAGVKKAPDNGLQVEGAVIFGGSLTIGADALVVAGETLTMSNALTVKSKQAGATALTVIQTKSDQPDPPESALIVGSFDTQSDQHIAVRAAGGSKYSAGIKLRASSDKVGFTIDYNDKESPRLQILRHWGDKTETVLEIGAHPGQSTKIFGDLVVEGSLWSNYAGKYRSLGGDGGHEVYAGWFDGTVPSDVRLKRGVQTVRYALDKVRHLRGVTFSWNEDALQHFTRDIETTFSAGPNATEPENQKVWQTVRDKRRNQLSTTQVGVLAQDVESVLPEAVTTDADGYKLVRYDNLIPLLIEAVKEQDQLAARQQAEIEQLKQALLVADTPRQQ